MTNEELLAKIKAEIERRIKECEATYPKDKGGYWSPEQEDSYAIAEEYKQLLSFLSTLEEQTKEVRNPIFDECLAKVDQKVREEVRENIDFEQALYDHFGQVKDFTLGMRIGKYFYELGCTRTAEKYDEIEYNRQRTEGSVPNDLEEAAQHSEILTYPMPEDGDIEKVFKVQEARVFHEIGFIAGAKWQKEQDEKEQADLFTIVALDAAQRAKEQMLKEARNHFVYNILSGNDMKKMIEIYNDEADCRPGDVVRVIIFKKED